MFLVRPPTETISENCNLFICSKDENFRLVSAAFFGVKCCEKENLISKWVNAKTLFTKNIHKLLMLSESLRSKISIWKSFPISYFFLFILIYYVPFVMGMDF